MIERFLVHFEPGMDERVISVCLPDGYGYDDARYPVMYMFDGQNAFEQAHAQYGKSWNLHEFLRGWEKDVMIVGIESSGESDRRMAEYCPYHLSPRAWEGMHGRGRATMQWLAHTLKPMIDARYRTLPDRLCTGVMGAAMGGLMSLYAVTAFNEVFSKAACLSPTMGTCYARLLHQIQAGGVDPDTRVYLSAGENEARDRKGLAHMVIRQLNIANALMRTGARAYPCLIENGRLCEEDWRAQAETFMRFLWLE